MGEIFRVAKSIHGLAVGYLLSTAFLCNLIARNFAMAKLESQHQALLTAEDLRVYINSQDDFAFEREVFQNAKGLGLSAEHAGLYEDPITNKPRQFDVRASKTIGHHKINLTLE